MLFFEDLVFGWQVLDHLLLLLVDPTGDDGDHQPPRLENENHGAHSNLRE
jgi:hypothetical protein